MISPYSLTVPGGVQNQILGLARALRNKGVDVRILAPCDGPPPDTGITPLGNSLPTAANGSIAPLAPDPSAQLRVIRALRDERFDLLHVHEPLAPGPTITAIVLKQSPIVATFHRAGPSKSYEFFNKPARWVANRIEVNCAVSEEAAATAREALGGSYEILFNGIELDRYAIKESLRSTQTIFFIGRHEPRKGLEVLIRAMKFLSDEVRLWIASDGPDTKRLQKATEDDHRIEWLGRISEEEKISRLQKATVFCAPSLGGESFGIVLLEAMASKTLVVASDIPGYSKLTRGGLDALLFRKGDSTALSKALDVALYDPNASQSIVESALTRVRQFSMDELAERYLQTYKKAIDQTPAVPLAKGGQFFSQRALYTKNFRAK